MDALLKTKKKSNCRNLLS